jgi:hypothetical protein
VLLALADAVLQVQQLRRHLVRQQRDLVLGARKAPLQRAHAPDRGLRRRLVAAGARWVLLLLLPSGG